MKTILQRKVKVILALLIFIVIYVINIHLNFLNIPQTEEKMKEYEFNMITVCTVFAGFSFSVLGLIISLSASKTIEKIKETSILLAYCRFGADSIVMFVISTFISIFVNVVLYSDFMMQICKKIPVANLHNIIEGLLYIVGIGYLIYGIILFVVSARKMVILMEKIFKKDIEEGKKKADIFLDAAKKQQERMNEYEEDEYTKKIF